VASDASTASSAPAAEAALRAAHQRLLQDGRIQFSLPQYQEREPSPPPDWLRQLLNFLGDIIGAGGPLFRIVFWAGLALIVALLLYMIGRSLLGADWPDFFRRKPKAAPAEPEWRPDEAQARVLLDDADRLAAEGRYAEAAHLLLYRSLDDIRGHRPRLIQPAVTSRELAAHDALPPAARSAFSAIARIVEHSFFGGLPVDADGYRDCRKAYEEFAFPRVWA
jgi:hypothetical protein